MCLDVGKRCPQENIKKARKLFLFFLYWDRFCLVLLHLFSEVVLYMQPLSCHIIWLILSGANLANVSFFLSVFFFIPPNNLVTALS